LDIKQKLNSQYEHISIYTSGFYADPEDKLDSRSKLLQALKSFVANQHPDVPFCLQLMTTNGEINIMPLGLLDLKELQVYEKQLRLKNGLHPKNEGIPLLIQFIPHTKEEEVKRKVIGTTEELFADFNRQFPLIWKTVKSFLAVNQQILNRIESQLLIDSQDVFLRYQRELTSLSQQQRQEKVGFALADDEVINFSHYLADMHEVQAIIISAASFVEQELLKDQLFVQIINNNVLRSTFFWVLDNTFYEILYYFIAKYQHTKNAEKISKHLQHEKKLLIINMRNDAYRRTQYLVEHPTKKVNLNHLFTDIFIPVAKQIAVAADKVS
jgi:hypothetical protein